MRTVFLLFDSLNRSALGAYGGDAIATPNFDRLAARSMSFDQHYTGSLPCMPARRDLHTGRLNFMHRSWGPLEAFDNSFADCLRDKGVYSHLITDHVHYFEDGGAGFHTRFDSWEFIRGQEYDPWVPMVAPPMEKFRREFSEKHYPLDRSSKRFQHMVNREVMQDEADFPGPKCFAAGFDFLDRNRDADDWLLMLECFDPHEPFHAPERFREAFPTGYNGGALDWPYYARVTENQAEMDEIRANYAALVAMCDEYLGRLLDYFDRHDMWKDTALVVTTDHGFLLSEHGWWGKCRMPYYEEISHIPLMIHDPRTPQAAGTRCAAVTQTPDIMPTLLGLHDADLPPEVRAHDLAPLLAGTSGKVRDSAVFGIFGGPVGIADGRHVLYHYPVDWRAPGLKEYTLAPQHMTGHFTAAELKTATMVPGFDFTRGVPLMAIDALPDAKRVPMNDGLGFDDDETRLYDLAADPAQKAPVTNHAVQARLVAQAAAEFRAHDAPAETYDWYGLTLKETA
ncbi:sulfatase [Salipiger abyssi]|uniref:Arylsulfatase A family protein n=1 Tax=Salipiger abyssi TaxID=1250539 RepID=A0A1P8UN29_9RHOB|nr:sulfatase [Salipiger abyssi]APZ50821.1 arylsulfatase A family protein [Salipiger abyssi]